MPEGVVPQLPPLKAVKPKSPSGLQLRSNTQEITITILKDTNEKQNWLKVAKLKIITLIHDRSLVDANVVLEFSSKIKKYYEVLIKRELE